MATWEDFKKYLADNGYVNPEIAVLKRHDRITVGTSFKTGYPNVTKIVITLRKHIEDVEPQDYPDLMMSLDRRDLIHCAEFMARSMALETLSPYKPTWYSERCDRCGRQEEDWVYPLITYSDSGERVELILCGECDLELIHGGEPLLDSSSVWALRRLNQ